MDWSSRAAGLLALSLLFSSSGCMRFWLTGTLLPVNIVEKLDTPVMVTGWSEHGLDLADGRRIQLLGVDRLPDPSPALAEAVKGGVEIDGNGRVYGLVRIWHWCGNDPVGKHIARVDLASMLAFLKEADIQESWVACGRTEGFGDAGWNNSVFHSFQTWLEARKVSSAEVTSGAQGS